MSAWQFTIFRLLFGSYLAIHFLQLVPYAGELFGADGLLGDPSLNPAHGLFPNPLDISLPEPWLQGILCLLALISLMFATGIQRQAAALILWFGWTALFHRNNLIANPSLAYVGLLLALSLLVPRGEPWSRPRGTREWAMPIWVFRTAWILMAAGYTFSGLTKLGSPSWIDGSALHFLLQNPLARPGIGRDLMLSLPQGISALMTWGALAAELLFLPLCLWSRSRPWIWLSMVLMHVGILVVIDFADLSFGMLMIHLFTFDPDWLLPKGGRAILAFDGECLMCSRSIRFLAEEDRGKLLQFTPLQGGRGQIIISRHGEEHGEIDSMLLDTGTTVLGKSGAVFGALDRLGGHWRIFAILGYCLPRMIRDRIYDLIARNRHHLRGKAGACALPSEALKKRLL